MAQITANDLKTRGIAAIEASLGDGRLEATVSVRGANRFVVMGLDHYQHLRECELEAALAETRADMQAGRFVVESPAEHVRRITSKPLAPIGGNAAPGLQRSTDGTEKPTPKSIRKPRTGATTSRPSTAKTATTAKRRGR